MGKQIQIFATDNDLIEIQSYLSSNYKCKFYQSFASQKEKLEIKNINNLELPFNRILVWNTEFDWTPNIEKTSTQPTYYYFKNGNTGPLFEISKSIIENNEPGRIYWSKNFLSNDLKYDVLKYELFFKNFINWVKKISIKQKDKTEYLNSYYMKNAWEIKEKLNRIE